MRREGEEKEGGGGCGHALTGNIILFTERSSFVLAPSPRARIGSRTFADRGVGERGAVLMRCAIGTERAPSISRRSSAPRVSPRRVSCRIIIIRAYAMLPARPPGPFRGTTFDIQRFKSNKNAPSRTRSVR